MDDLIKSALYAIFPAMDKLAILAANRETDGSVTRPSGFEEVRNHRAEGRLISPLIIYGFESEKHIRRLKAGSIIDAPGVFYLKLPAPLEEIENILKRANTCLVSKEYAIDDESIRRYAVSKIMALKHQCDNVWNSLAMNANRAKKALKHSPESKPKALFEFNKSIVQKLSEEYRNLELNARRLGVIGNDQVNALLDDAIQIIERIRIGQDKPDMAVDLAFNCVEKIKEVSNILENAKRIERSE